MAVILWLLQNLPGLLGRCGEGVSLGNCLASSFLCELGSQVRASLMIFSKEQAKTGHAPVLPEVIGRLS
jgi:hypothetical protein